MILWKYIYNYKPIDIRAFLRINIHIEILLEQLLRCYMFFNYKHTNNDSNTTKSFTFISIFNRQEITAPTNPKETMMYR